jgi:hypothetical protein
MAKSRDLAFIFSPSVGDALISTLGRPGASRTSWATPLRNKGPVRPSVCTGSEQPRPTPNGSEAAPASASSEGEIEAAKGRASSREDVPPVCRFPSHTKVVVTWERDLPGAGEQGSRRAGGRHAGTPSPLTREFISPRWPAQSAFSLCARGSYFSSRCRGISPLVMAQAQALMVV